MREVLLAKGLTRMALAEKAGLTLNYVGEVERGESLASLETIVRIAGGLGITGGELLKRAGL
jgi:transcriptional regulator with XRE-family HTH domain